MKQYMENISQKTMRVDVLKKWMVVNRLSDNYQ